VSGWRVWLAFEARPGITLLSTRDTSKLWRALFESCRGHDGKVDVVEFERCLDLMVDYSHAWGAA
jgi:hypothetical protein